MVAMARLANLKDLDLALLEKGGKREFQEQESFIVMNFNGQYALMQAIRSSQKIKLKNTEI